jgi:hypothetical protein
MAFPAKEETEAGFPPLLTYSALGGEFVSPTDENNLTMMIVSVSEVPLSCVRDRPLVLLM